MNGRNQTSSRGLQQSSISSENLKGAPNINIFHTNLAQIRQSRPDSGRGSQVKVLTTFSKRCSLFARQRPSEEGLPQTPGRFYLVCHLNVHVHVIKVRHEVFPAVFPNVVTEDEHVLWSPDYNKHVHYRSTSLIRTPPPQDHCVALGMGLLQGPKGLPLLMSEVPL